MSLADRLGNGTFVVTAELGPPAAPDPDAVRIAARALARCVHAANVTDNQAATVKMSPLVSAMLMAEEGLEPILQLTGRDRNILALQSDLLGAWAVGITTVLALSGDPLSVGPYEGLATRVADVDSEALTRLIASLNGGVMRAGEALATPTGFLIAGAANPLVDSVDRLDAKVEAGVGMLQTNIVFDVERFADWLTPLVDAGVTERAPLLVGVTPPRSGRMLRHLHDHIPGVEVNQATFSRMQNLDDEAARTEGIHIAGEVIAAVRELEGVAGVHIMAPGWEADAVPRVVAAAGLAPDDYVVA